MLINELPAECLVAIFDHINNLKDLINCFKVCTKWRDAIVTRAIKVKYLIEHPNDPHDCVHGDEEDSAEFADGDEEDAAGNGVKKFPYDYSSDCVYYEREDPIEGTCLRRLFRNLTIAEISYEFRIKVEREVIIAFIRSQGILRGIINFSDEQIEGYCGVLEMIAGDHIMAYDMRNGPSIKQLYVGTNTREVNLSHFPNLERLHITNNEVPYSYYYGPVLEKLKIVELGCSLRYATDINYGFQFMDSCPTLQSAHISINGRWITDETLKHGSLQDLVIDFCNNDDFEWNDLSSLLMKYPNLKHLALWKQLNITDEHIKQLVPILPNLVLFDVRGCVAVTEGAACYVKSYYGRYGRPIRFYFDDNDGEIGLDWPHLSTKAEKISRGFDFLKHCFLKDFDDLPFFLVPIDD